MGRILPVEGCKLAYLLEEAILDADMLWWPATLDEHLRFKDQSYHHA